ncbi:MAG: CBS domain-containing protein [Deltaproteobacteria bacterium]
MQQKFVGITVLKEALDEISAASEAARLQIHLLSLEAKQRGGALGDSIEALEHRLDRNLHDALATGAEKARQLTKTVQDSLGRQPAPASDVTRIGALMTDPVHVCSAEEPVQRAAQIMWDADCGAVPVVDAEGRLCGIITDRDICMATYTKGVAPSSIRVADVMSRHVRSCSADDSLQRAVASMADAQVHRLPVVGADGRPIGMISLADIARSATLLGQRDGEALVFQLLAALSKRRSSGSKGQALAAE